MTLSLIREWLSGWFEARSAKQREREVARAEKARQATLRAIERRRDKHQAFRFLEGTLRDETSRSLAASCGWERRA